MNKKRDEKNSGSASSLTNEPNNAEDPKSLSCKRRGSTLDENVHGRACGSTASESLPAGFAEV